MTAISNTRDLTTLTTATLIGKVREHELEMITLKEMETMDRKTRSLALNTKAADVESSEQNCYKCNYIENLNLLTRRYNKKSNNGSTQFTCFGCGK